MYRKRGFWYGAISHRDGKRAVIALHTKDEQEALRRLSEVVKDNLPATPLDAMIDSYIKEKQYQLSLNTIRRYRYASKNLCSYLPKKDIKNSDITQYKIRRYAEGGNAYTVNLEMRFLKAVLRYGVENEKVQHMPKISLDKELLKDRVLSCQEEAVLLRNLSPSVKDLCVVALQTGMRISEIAGLKHSNIDLPQRMITVIGKGSKIRSIPLNDVVYKILTKWLRVLHIGNTTHNVFYTKSGRAFVIRDIEKMFRNGVVKSGIPTIHFHDLRHTFATRLILSGVDISVVSKLLGHSNVSITMRYLHYDVRPLREAVEHLVHRLYLRFAASGYPGCKRAIYAEDHCDNAAAGQCHSL
jgi:site-specific recombinase XerD